MVSVLFMKYEKTALAIFSTGISDPLADFFSSFNFTSIPSGPAVVIAEVSQSTFSR